MTNRLYRDLWITTRTVNEKIRVVRSSYHNRSLRLASYKFHTTKKGNKWYERCNDFTIDLENDRQDKYHAFINPEYDDGIYDIIASSGLGYDTDIEVTYEDEVFRLVKFDTKLIDNLEELDEDDLPDGLSV